MDEDVTDERDEQTTVVLKFNSCLSRSAVLQILVNKYHLYDLLKQYR